MHTHFAGTYHAILVDISRVNLEEHSAKVDTLRPVNYIWAGQYKKCEQYNFKFTSEYSALYLKPTETRLNVKTIIKQQQILNIVDLTCASLFTNYVCLHYKSSSWAVLISHGKMVANSIPPSLVLYILGVLQQQDTF